MTARRRNHYYSIHFTTYVKVFFVLTHMATNVLIVIGKDWGFFTGRGSKRVNTYQHETHVRPCLSAEINILMTHLNEARHG